MLIMLPWKPTKRLAPFVLCTAFLFIFYTFVSVPPDLQYKATFDYDCRKNASEPYPNLIHYCIKGPSIFFVETGGKNLLNERKACAIESAARENPSMTVTVLMTGAFLDISDPLTNAMTHMPNVNIRVIDLDVFLHDTPMWSWYRVGKWKESLWKASHLSDALRFVLMWKYGGMYIDLDTVTLRSMENLHNAVITENWERIAAGILVFDQGHEVMDRCVVDFSLHYDKNKFAFNGPELLARNIKKYCDIHDVGKISGSNCHINILPPEAAFPIPYDAWEEYFTPSNVKNVSSHFSSTYLIHVWNKYSFAGRLIVGKNSIYEMAMQQHCPLVYSYVKEKLFV